MRKPNHEQTRDGRDHFAEFSRLFFNRLNQAVQTAKRELRLLMQ